jgi:hAT family C-terminal dimerisation region
MFLTLYKIVMDFLPIQASAVPCEHVFSSSSDTFTKKRNRLSPYLMEALQVIKFALKKEQMHFTEGWAASQKDMEYNLMCATGSASHEDLLASGSSDLLISATSGTTSGGCDYEALLRIIAEDECDDIADDITTVSIVS